MAGGRIFPRLGDARQYSFAGWFILCFLDVERSQGQDQKVIRAPINAVERNESQPTGSQVKATLLRGWLAVDHFLRPALSL